MTIQALLDKAAANKTRLIVITASKVTISQNGTWQVFPDQGELDERRWAVYSCPEAYESSTGEVP